MKFLSIYKVSALYYGNLRKKGVWAEIDCNLSVCLITKRCTCGTLQVQILYVSSFLFLFRYVNGFEMNMFCGHATFFLCKVR